MNEGIHKWLKLKHGGRESMNKQFMNCIIIMINEKFMWFNKCSQIHKYAQ